MVRRARAGPVRARMRSFSLRLAGTFPKKLRMLQVEVCPHQPRLKSSRLQNVSNRWKVILGLRNWLGKRKKRVTMKLPLHWSHLEVKKKKRQPKLKNFLGSTLHRVLETRQSNYGKQRAGVVSSPLSVMTTGWTTWCSRGVGSIWYRWATTRRCACGTCTMAAASASSRTSTITLSHRLTSAART
jgi:hypothetical protein